MNILTGDAFRKAAERMIKQANECNRPVIIIHPSLVTYDEKMVNNWNDYKKRNRKNKLVKSTRDLLGLE